MKRKIVLQGLPHYLSEDASDFFKEAEATDIDDRMTAGMDVGILIIPGEDDGFHYSVVLEEQIVLRDVKDLPHAVALLVGLIFGLNITYPKKLRYTFEIIQKIFIDLGGDRCSMKVHGLKNRLLRKTL
ncbi:hypothetical protein IRJ41_019818 [Triplophysa rosa]|uniref:Uncharacterized protein n=1 Tax=Triplophysa rosa TaxID=992332 RepID=A0A9W8C7Y7_TRIRA|nr:hypothetical protein IRJ41_019818 [Triplophysa rosa]